MADDPKQAETEMFDSATYRAKITIATLECNPARAKAAKQSVHIARIFGIASGLKAVNAPNGDVFTALTGRFEGWNLDEVNDVAFAKMIKTGELPENVKVIRSGTLYLPAGFHDAIQAQLETASENKESKFSAAPYVEFDLLIDAEPANNPIGYSYTAKQLVPIHAADPLATMRDRGLRALAATTQKSLPAA